MASWHQPPEVFQPVRDATVAWELSQPQLFLEIDDVLSAGLLPETMPHGHSPEPSAEHAQTPVSRVARGEY